MLKKILALSFLLSCFFLFPQKHIDTLLERGINLYSKGEYPKAIVVFNECAALAEKKGDAKNLSNIFNNLGNAYSQTGNSPLALTNYQKAIKLAEQINDKFRIAKTNLNIGSLYSEQGDFKSALFYFDKSERMGNEIKDISITADCLNNKGIIYEQQNNYEQALSVYTKALELYKQQKNKERIALTLNNLGIVYKYLKQFPKSIEHYNQSIKLSEQLGDQFLVSANLNNVGNVYSLTGDYKKALELFFGSMEIAKRIKATNIIIEAYEGISTAYFKLGKYHKAYEYRKLYDEEKSGFINTERSKQIAEMQTKYETEKKENQIQLLKQNNYINNLEIKEQNNDIKKRNIFIVLTLMIFVLIIVALYYQGQKQKLKNQLEKDAAIKEMEENERLRIAKDIHDELGSGLTKIALVAEYSKQHLNGNKLLTDNIHSISKTSKELVENMRDLVWALNPDNTTLENLVSRMREYSSEYLEELSVQSNFNFPSDVPSIKISKEIQRNIFLTFKEAINNSIKYSEAGTLDISLKLDNNYFDITVADDGIGFEKNRIKKTGNGLHNMEQRIKAIGGEFLINSTKGTIVCIKIDLAKMADHGHKLLL
jgi:signal transduction histidine kinase